MTATDSPAFTRGALRWNMGWRTGVIGGILYLVIASMRSVIVYGVETVLPGPSFAAYLLFMALRFLVPAIILGAAAAVAVPYLQRYGLGVQATLFGLLLGITPVALIVTVRLVTDLASNPEHGFSWAGLFSAFGREFAWGIGVPMLLAAALGWALASLGLKPRESTV